MKKLSLKLDELRIESFETTRDKGEEPGSVEAHQTPTANSGGSCFESSCRPIMCRTDDTCAGQLTCPYTCDPYVC